MATVLVTGANGFIGYHLVKTLIDQGWSVTGMVRSVARSTRVAGLGVGLVCGDVLDQQSLRRAVAGKSIVFHVAGATAALRPRQFYDVNRRGTCNVLQACAAQPTPPLVILLSSLAAAGPSQTGRPREETEPPAPVSDYGRSKLGGEQAAREWAAEVPCSVVRPGIVIGEGDRVSLAMFRAVQHSRVHVVPGLVRQRYSVMHAADLAELMVSVAEGAERLQVLHSGTDSDTAWGHGVYFAESDERPTYHDIGRLIGLALGYAVTISVPVPRPVVWGVATVGYARGLLTGRPAFLSFDKAREATTGEWICSGQKARQQLNLQLAVPLADRFAQTAHWYRREGWL